jgi:hypothetical protein
VTVASLSRAVESSCYDTCMTKLPHAIVGGATAEAVATFLCDNMTGTGTLPDKGCDQDKACGEVCVKGGSMGKCQDTSGAASGKCTTCVVPPQGCDGKTCSDKCLVDNFYGECHDGPGPPGSCGACLIPPVSSYEGTKKVIGGCDEDYGDGAECWKHAKYLIDNHKSQAPPDALNTVIREQRIRRPLSSPNPPSCAACHPLEVAARIKGVPLTDKERQTITQP